MLLLLERVGLPLKPLLPFIFVWQIDGKGTKRARTKFIIVAVQHVEWVVGQNTIPVMAKPLQQSGIFFWKGKLHYIFFHFDRRRRKWKSEVNRSIQTNRSTPKRINHPSVNLSIIQSINQSIERPTNQSVYQHAKIFQVVSERSQLWNQCRGAVRHT